ncbi:MAG: hypothetical protein HY043_23015 [Verrucomicrobia bacterium]|nr:hypothetical protein [Verrucomicrobiota bacterium]
MLACFAVAHTARSATNVILAEVPDYQWWRGCFGTASGNLMGYWDRHGFPNFYTGPTASGIAPLNSFGSNIGIQSMWASKAGFDGRPADQPGHEDDYWVSYESTAPDPYVTAGRPEHAPDCIGDFIGLSQDKWTNLGDECDGNIDGFSFVFWDKAGDRRVNYIPQPRNGQPTTDIQSGLRAWTQYRGNDCEVFTQLTDFNPEVPAGKGFTFDDLKAEIDAGYPVLLFMQKPTEKSRPVGAIARANPHIHGMLAYGYYISDSGANYVRYRTSWASGDNVISEWTARNWQADLPVRGIIGYHPLPQIKNTTFADHSLTLTWDGPDSSVLDLVNATATSLHAYVVEQSAALYSPAWTAVTPPLSQHTATISNCCDGSTFFRVRLVKP